MTPRAQYVTKDEFDEYKKYDDEYRKMVTGQLTEIISVLRPISDWMHQAQGAVKAIVWIVGTLIGLCGIIGFVIKKIFK